MLTPVILAGGLGSRLWPLSRNSLPKQFLALSGKETMLQATLSRLKSLNIADPIVVCNREHRFLVAEQLQAIKYSAQIVLEPEGRNTAPAVCLASNLLKQQNKEDQLLLILAADHMVKKPEAFINAVQEAIPLAEAGKLVTFGVEPSSANTGYGYIKFGKKINKSSIFQVEQFVEKPNEENARKFLDSGKYLWNSGIFLFKSSSFMKELTEFEPDIVHACEAALGKDLDNFEFIEVDHREFKKCPDKSIDFAVMEKTTEAVVKPLDVGWSDVGSWSALWDIDDKDEQGNVSGNNVINKDSINCYVRSEDRLITTIGLEEIVVVDTKDALLIASKEKSQEVKGLVSEMKEVNRKEYQHHREVKRPWGVFDSVDSGKNYQVKRIVVKPKEKLSLQSHQHRSEHWIVVSGCAKVTLDEETFILRENESTYIAAGSVHSLENPESDSLILIEVQFGSYLGEDDILRIEDKYGRE